MRRSLLICLLCIAGALAADRPPLSAPAQKIVAVLHTLRSLPDAERATRTQELAGQIEQLPSSDPAKLRLAVVLASLSTEGDFGHATLQAVADALSGALREQPGPDDAYDELASLVRYEHVTTTLKDPKLTAAEQRLANADAARATADFTLSDLDGKQWSLHELRGKIVLVNFWATWCPPCRKELPDLQALYQLYKDRGLIVLAISDEDAGKIRSFLSHTNVSYPVLLDSNKKVAQLFGIEGNPRTFIYGRSGKLAAESIDMRTRHQFLEMLAQSGLPTN